MGGVSVDISGDAQVVAALRAVGPHLEAAVKGAVAEIALNIERGAKQACPVDTGRLRSSIGVDFEEGGLAASVGSNVEYAEHVEYGTSRMAAQPYLTPAKESEVSKAPATVAKHVRRVTGG